MSALSEQLNEIHARLIDGRPTASLELFNVGLGPLIGFLMREYSRMPRSAAYDLAVDALLSHADSPTRYDPSKSSLWTFLCLAAKRDALDALRKWMNRGGLDKNAVYDIELWGVQAKNAYEGIENDLDAETIMHLHGRTIVKNAVEGKVLDLMLEGERETMPFAEAMGLDASVDHAAEVKKIKDRLWLRLRKVHDEI